MADKLYKFFLISILLFQTVSAFAEDENTDVAEVNGSLISSTDVRREMNMMYQQAVSQGVYPDDSEINAYWENALNALIGRELLFQSAVENKYQADQDAVEEYINALSMNYGGMEQLETALEDQGMDIEKLRNDTKRYYVISNFVDNELQPDIEVSDEQSLKYYNDNSEYFVNEETIRASHILIKTSEGADEAEMKSALERIEALHVRAVSGEDFAELAAEYSDCPSSEQGGDLGDFGHGMMVPPFDRAAFALEVGEISNVVQTQYGFHIIKLTGRNSGEDIPYDSVKQQIIDYLTGLELEGLVTEYVDGLRESADIKLF